MFEGEKYRMSIKKEWKKQDEMKRWRKKTQKEEYNE